MIKAVLYDIGGVMYTASAAEGQKRAFAEGLISLLDSVGIPIHDTVERFEEKLSRRAEEYKTHAERTMYELPAFLAWRDFYLADYSVPERALMRYAETLSHYYDGHARLTYVKRPHLNEAMEELHAMGVRQGVISNILSKTFVPQLLAEYGVDELIECTVLSSEAGYRKPDGRIFTVTLERLGLSPDECAYVGDTISRDVIGARNAKLSLMIQVDNPAVYHRDAAFTGGGYAPDYLIHDLSELSPIIRAANA